MPKIHPVQNSFNAGVISPKLFGRTDLAKYPNGLKTGDNVIIMPQGGLVRRGGFENVCNFSTDDLIDSGGVDITPAASAADTDDDTEIIPFIFSQSVTQNNIIEVAYESTETKSYIRIWRADTNALVKCLLVDSEGNALPWNKASIAQLKQRYLQIDDLLFLLDGENDLYYLERSGLTMPGTWQVKLAILTRSPLDLSNSNPITYEYYHHNSTFFGGRNLGNSAANAFGFNQFFTAHAQNVYIGTGKHDENLSNSPLSFGDANHLYGNPNKPSYLINNTLQAGAGKAYFSLKLTGKLFFDVADAWEFALNTDSAAEFYIDGKRVASDYGDDAENPQSVNEFSDSTDPATAETITAGQHNFELRLVNGTSGYSCDVAWRRTSIPTADADNSAFADSNPFTVTRQDHSISSTSTPTTEAVVVVVEIDGTGTPDTYKVTVDGVEVETLEPITGGAQTLTGLNTQITFPQTTGYTVGDNWTFRQKWGLIPTLQFQKTKFTDTTTAPLHLQFWQGRLWILGTKSEPNKILGSKSLSLFDYSIGANDADAIEYEIGSGENNPIVGSEIHADGLIIFTKGGAFLLHGGGSPVTPSNIILDKVSYDEFSDIRPVAMENKVLAVSSSKLQLKSYQYNIQSKSLDCNDISILSNHLMDESINQMALGKSMIVSADATPTDILWFIEDVSTGRSLRSYTISFEHDVIAGTTHTINTSGVKVHSIITLAGSNGEDILYAIVNISNVYYLCYLKYDNTQDNVSSAVTFVSEIETLPFVRDVDGETIADFKKRWVVLNIKLLQTTGITVARSTDSSDTQTLSDSASSSVLNKNFKMLGWDKEAGIIIKQPTAARMCILSVFGNMAVSPK